WTQNGEVVTANDARERVRDKCGDSNIIRGLGVLRDYCISGLETKPRELLWCCGGFHELDATSDSVVVVDVRVVAKFDRKLIVARMLVDVARDDLTQEAQTALSPPNRQATIECF